MNDYTIGAMEALSWVRAILKKCGDLESFCMARKEIDEMIMKLASGAAVSFHTKARFIPEL